jgi:hypothetical protein
MTDELRNRIAQALQDAWGPGSFHAKYEMADAVLGVLSPTDGWEQVGWLTRHGRTYESRHRVPDEDARQFGWEPLFRRVDGAAPQPEWASMADAAAWAHSVLDRPAAPQPERCPHPEPGSIGALSHCIHWHNAEDNMVPCCWCGSTEDDSGSCPLAPPDGEVERLRAALREANEALDAFFYPKARRILRDALSGSTTRREERPCECPTQVVTYHDERCPLVDAPAVPEWGSGAL